MHTGRIARPALASAGVLLLAWVAMSMSGDGPTPPTLEDADSGG